MQAFIFVYLLSYFYFLWLERNKLWMEMKKGVPNVKFLRLMPRPSARTKYFLSRTIFKLSRTKILSRVKKSIFCFEKSFKIKFLVERTMKIYFQLEIFIMHGFWKQKIDFLTLDKIFVLDNLNIVLDKKYFVRADGRGIST